MAFMFIGFETSPKRIWPATLRTALPALSENLRRRSRARVLFRQKDDGCLSIRSFSSRVQHDRERRDLVRFNIPAHQEAFAVFAHVVTEEVRRRNRRPTSKLK